MIAIIITIMLFLNIGKTKNSVLSVVLPYDLSADQIEWIEGIKTYGKDTGTFTDIFYEEECNIENRVENEQRRVNSQIITLEEWNEKSEDQFYEGYTKAKSVAENSKKSNCKKDKNTLRIGFSLYDSSDEFIRELTYETLSKLKKTCDENDIYLITDIEDGRQDSVRQDKQIQYFINNNCDIVVINAVDPWQISNVIHKLKEKDIPVIFYNREPEGEDIELWEKAYYVGSDGENLGQLQGEMVIDVFKNKSLEVDKNNDNILQYILVEGEEGHSDAIRRTDSMLKAIKRSINSEQIASISADWNRKEANQLFSQIDENKIEACEAVICNNDEMALGVSEALSENFGVNMPVFGIDGTKESYKAIEKHMISGTVSQNNELQSDIIVDIIQDIWYGNQSKKGNKQYIDGTKVTL